MFSDLFSSNWPFEGEICVIVLSESGGLSDSVGGAPFVVFLGSYRAFEGEPDVAVL